MTSPTRLYPGDLVTVKSPEQILATLDACGTLDGLPFMPEMAQFCGQRFTVFRRVVKTCSSGTSSTIRAFRGDDVVLLENLRCSGAAHDGCEKACMIFWREAWLQKVLDSSGPRVPTSQGHELLWARLKTSTGLNTYFCQASELSRAAPGISRRERFSKCFGEIAARNCTTFEMAQRITIWLFWRVRRLLFGPFGRGTNKTTPAETLHLKAGELVQVRSMPSISQTLNSKSFNRGLWFSPEMRRLCGTQQRVAQRIDKLIVDGTGEMRQLHDTVYLEGSMCGCAYVAFGGCSRCEFNYWREIWLRRPSGSS
ncbi:MAG: hypothetical protein WAK48_06290 [Candidatus Acidiferrum sp.]|jgi:hypothetical protein